MTKYYVEERFKYADGLSGKILVGGKFKKKQSEKYDTPTPAANHYTLIVKDHEIQLEGYMVSKALYDNPIKTERAAKILCNKLNKSYYDSNINTESIVKVECRVKEYPEEVPYNQFKAFIVW